MSCPFNGGVRHCLQSPSVLRVIDSFLVFCIDVCDKMLIIFFDVSNLSAYLRDLLQRSEMHLNQAVHTVKQTHTKLLSMIASSGKIATLLARWVKSGEGRRDIVEWGDELQALVSYTSTYNSQVSSLSDPFALMGSKRLHAPGGSASVGNTIRDALLRADSAEAAKSNGGSLSAHLFSAEAIDKAHANKAFPRSDFNVNDDTDEQGDVIGIGGTTDAPAFLKADKADQEAFPNMNND